MHLTGGDIRASDYTKKLVGEIRNLCFVFQSCCYVEIAWVPLFAH